MTTTPPQATQDEGEPVSKTYRLDERDMRTVIMETVGLGMLFVDDGVLDQITRALTAAGYSRRTQPAQDEGAREKLIALIGHAHKGKTSAFIADAILSAGYSRRTEATPDTDAVKWIRVVSEELVNAGFPPGDRDVALRSIRALIKGRTEATGEATETATNIVTNYLTAEDRRGVASKLIADVANAITEGARAAEERATRAESELRRVAIAQHVRMTYSGETIPNGKSCHLCKAEWRQDEEEKHTPDCFFARALRAARSDDNA